MHYVFRSPVMFHFFYIYIYEGEETQPCFHLRCRTHTRGQTISNNLTQSHCFGAATMALFRKKNECSCFVRILGNRIREGGGSYIKCWSGVSLMHEIPHATMRHSAVKSAKIHLWTDSGCVHRLSSPVDWCKTWKNPKAFLGQPIYYIFCCVCTTNEEALFIKQSWFVLMTPTNWKM